MPDIDPKDREAAREFLVAMDAKFVTGIEWTVAEVNSLASLLSAARREGAEGAARAALDAAAQFVRDECYDCGPDGTFTNEKEPLDASPCCGTCGPAVHSIRSLSPEGLPGRPA